MNLEVAKSRFRQKPDPVPIRSGSAVKVNEPDPVPIRSGSFRIRGLKTGTGLPGSGSDPIRFGPNIRSDRFQRTGALFFTVGFPIVVIQPKSSRVFIRMFRRLKWDKRGDKSVGKWSKTQKNCYIAVGKLLASCYCEEYAGKKMNRWNRIGTGSQEPDREPVMDYPVPNRI